MKHLRFGFFWVCTLVVGAIVFSYQVRASSNQAYQDYVFQFGQYRSFFNDFRVAVNQYHQFNSLESQQDALDKAKRAIAQRDTVVRTYLLFLNEKLSENPGLASTELGLYRSIITNEIAFLDQHSTLVPSISSIPDAETSSKEFIKQYAALQAAMRQTIVAIELGYLNYFAQEFEKTAIQAQLLIGSNRTNMTPAKQAALDRWLLELSNKRSLYQQKASTIRTASFKLIGDEMEQSQKFNLIQTDLLQARQYIIEGIGFLNELGNALKYQ